MSIKSLSDCSTTMVSTDLRPKQIVVKSHQRTHAVKSHYELYDCTFCQHNGWMEHKRHTPIEVKLYYSCESCDKEFTTYAQLTLHRQVCATLVMDRTCEKSVDFSLLMAHLHTE
ncbi:zinc finger protein 253-like [Aphis craccivora]|uniref:Zinc finger protein 253-like n=1 Tax=Aphis craccivora TaxID=307492 RepID=A0A6G0ZLX3_APHCR|nr:zinc finger protein 253-like [Aphis craccivora]